MVDFAPLADAGRQVADHGVEAEFVGQLLQLALPQPDPLAIAAAAIGGDQQPGRVGVARLRHHWRMLLTAKAAVSWLTPTLTHPAFAARS